MSITEQICGLVETHQEQLIALSDQVWHLAELRFNEYQSCALHEELLVAHGFTVQKQAGGIATAFVAEYGSGGPVIGFLGEYDALPGLSQQSGVAQPQPIEDGAPGHGCGHNLLGTGALGAALALRYYLEQNNLPGTVRYYGCPAEEGGGGKVLMVEAGLFDDTDIALTWHPSDATYVQSAPTLATKSVNFHFSGRSAHAAKNPHIGRSALDAVELTNIGVNYLREHVPSDARIHYAITDAGGSAPNVVQPKAAVIHQIRSPRGGQVDEIYERVCNIARGAALMTGTELEIVDETHYLNIIPNTTLENLMHQQLEKIGLPEYDEADHEFAQQIRATLSDEEKKQFNIPETQGLDLSVKMPPFRPHYGMHWASTDVGDVSWKIPTAQFRAAVWAVGTSAHSWQAVAQGKSPLAYKGTMLAAKVMASAAAELLKNPQLIEEAKTELAKARAEQS